MKRLILLGLAAVMIASCSDSEPSSTASDINANDSLLTVIEPGYEMAFILPKEMLAHDDVWIRYNDSRGYLEIDAGLKFNVQVIDDSLSVMDFKQELLDDQMFTYKFFDEGEEAFTYQQVLPNGQDFYYQFVQRIDLNGKPYFIQSNPAMEFTLKNVKDMKKAIESIRAAE